MEITRGKILALTVALAYLALATAAWGWDAKGIAAMCLVLSGPLVLIWFPDEIGDATKLASRIRIESPTPPVVISLMGWFFLVGLPFLPLVSYLLQ